MTFDWEEKELENWFLFVLRTPEKKNVWRGSLNFNLFVERFSRNVSFLILFWLVKLCECWKLRKGYMKQTKAQARFRTHCSCVERELLTLNYEFWVQPLARIWWNSNKLSIKDHDIVRAWFTLKWSFSPLQLHHRRNRHAITTCSITNRRVELPWRFFSCKLFLFLEKKVEFSHGWYRTNQPFCDIEQSKRRRLSANSRVPLNKQDIVQVRKIFYDWSEVFGFN